MARYEDYVKVNPPGPVGIDDEINVADAGQQERLTNETPVDWEERYKNLEQLNSRQAQTVGEYRNIIDNFITNPTPEPEASVAPPEPLTSDELYANPAEAIERAVEAHPAIQEAREVKALFVEQQREQAVARFTERHPDHEEIKASPEFANWVLDNPTRQALAQSAHKWDMNSADALFSLYKAEQGIAVMHSNAQEETAIRAATLEDSSAIMPSATVQFSRGEYVAKLTRAKQGDLEAEAWINRYRGAYREALESGNVRD